MRTQSQPLALANTGPLHCMETGALPASAYYPGLPPIQIVVV
jgi:hypothetical protein